jgi:membrane protease YdiL (CAAX protease family)
LATRTLNLARAFTRDDGRERVALPFWDGVLSAIGATALGFLGALVVMVPVVFAAVLLTGTMPSTAPGHLLLDIVGIAFYLVAGWFAWTRLRAMGASPLRPLRGADVRALALGIATLLALRVALAALLTATHQTAHVQAGFEHFSVVTKVPAATAISVALTVLSAVMVGPIVEELVFRGLLFGALARPLGVVTAALISSLMFGAAHGDLVLFPALAAVGMVSAIAYAATGNLTVSILLHAANNAVPTAFLILGSFSH